MAYKTVKASWLVSKFQLMLDEKWHYVAGAARYGEVDCSGAFSYWYSQADSYMFHGSNSISRKATKKLGKIGEIELKPGMAVFRWSPTGEPDQYKADGLGNFRHIGLYVGNGITIDARDTETGVASGKISQWDYAAELKYTNYDLSEGEEEPSKEFEPFEGMVTTSGGILRLRKSPNTSSTIKAQIPNGTVLWLQEEQNNWYKTNYLGINGWVSGDFIQKAKPVFFRQLSVDVRDENVYRELTDWLNNNMVEYYVMNGDD